ncbi:gamma-glutamyl-gamma-aminobutyrate hydrolase family protein, partial [Rhizobium ruizarguesonis]
MVAIPADIRNFDGATWHALQHQYLRAALNASGVMSFIIPAFEEGYDTDAILDRVDGRPCHSARHRRARDARCWPNRRPAG